MNLICIDCGWTGFEKVEGSMELCPYCGGEGLCDNDMDEHIMCQSYPNCDLAPGGCDIATDM